MEQKVARKRLSEDQVAQLIEEWDEHPIEYFAEEFGVGVNTIRAMVKEVREARPDLLPKKRRKGRKDVALAAIAMYEERNQQ